MPHTTFSRPIWKLEVIKGLRHATSSLKKESLYTTQKLNFTSKNQNTDIMGAEYAMGGFFVLLFVIVGLMYYARITKPAEETEEKTETV